MYDAAFETTSTTETDSERTDALSVEGFFGATILAYTRADALADGVLIDVSVMAKEAGFSVPVAVTAALQADIEDIPSESGQDIEGRLWDVLWMGRLAVQQAINNGNESDMLYYELLLPLGSQCSATDEPYTVKSVIGPGVRGEPVLTLMKPGED